MFHDFHYNNQNVSILPESFDIENRLIIRFAQLPFIQEQHDAILGITKIINECRSGAGVHAVTYPGSAVPGQGFDYPKNRS